MNLENKPVAESLKKFQDSFLKACQKAGRDAHEIRTVYVTKTVPFEKIREAVLAGVRDLGENRVQELLEKKEAFRENFIARELRWHMMGHLQTNKVKQVAGEVTLIHSLDRPELAVALEKEAQAQSLPSVNCLVQVNSSGEQTKFGLAPEQVEAFVAGLKGPAIRIQGLMTIGPFTEDRDKIRAAFRSVRELRDRLKKKFSNHGWDILSMGMSGDYEIALEEGSTMLRIGTAIFGARNS